MYILSNNTFQCSNDFFPESGCDIPEAYHGEWYSFELGQDISTSITADKWSRTSTQEELECVAKFTHEQQQGFIEETDSSMVNTTMLMAVV